MLIDSEIVLNSIQHRPLKEVGIIIFNRLIEIGRITCHLESLGYQVPFMHVASQVNPADCATRGLTKAELQDHFWRNGPMMLGRPSPSKKEISQCSLQEFNEVLSTNRKKTGQDQHDIEVFSGLAGRNFLSIKRIIARVLRFIAILITRMNQRNSDSIQVSSTRINTDSSTNLSGIEIANAEKILVQNHQRAKITPSVLRGMHHLTQCLWYSSTSGFQN